MVQKTPRGFRLHIGFFGRRNAGKSTLLNALARQQVSIVADHPGTTTDPVFKAMELRPFGPVVLIDTAGADDTGDVGNKRVQKMRRVLDRTDVAVLVAEATGWSDFEADLLAELHRREVPTCVVLSKSDLTGDETPDLSLAADVRVVRTGFGPDGDAIEVDDLERVLLDLVPTDLLNTPTILGDLVPTGGTAVLVVPIDDEAPAGRLILPQVQALRDLLDHDALAMVCKETNLATALAGLRTPPDLVVTDSQAFAEVAAIVPDDVPLTSFSILFARLKGDLQTLALSALAIDTLRPGDPVLIAESCTHHAVDDDIGTVKIPRLLAAKAGGNLQVTNVQGHDFPDDLARYRLVIHCGACMTNRREMLSRLAHCAAAGVPATNYGVTIAHCLGILDRALEPFADVRAAWRTARNGHGDP